MTVDDVEFALSDVENSASVCLSDDNYYSKVYFDIEREDVESFLHNGSWNGNMEYEKVIEYMYLVAKHWQQIQDAYTKEKARVKVKKQPDCFYISDVAAYYYVDTEEEEFEEHSYFSFSDGRRAYVKVVDLLDKGNLAYFYTTREKRFTYYKTSKNGGESVHLELDCISHREKVWQALDVYGERHDIRIE